MAPAPPSTGESGKDKIKLFFFYLLVDEWKGIESHLVVRQQQQQVKVFLADFLTLGLEIRNRIFFFSNWIRLLLLLLLL